MEIRKSYRIQIGNAIKISKQMGMSIIPNIWRRRDEYTYEYGKTREEALVKFLARLPQLPLVVTDLFHAYIDDIVTE